MNKFIKFLVLMMTLAAFTIGCSSNNSGNQGSDDPSKPKPQVRVEVMPSATLTLAPVVTSTIEPAPSPAATAAQVFYDPPPDVDQLAEQIDQMMTEIENKLGGEKYILK